ncbi:neurogenic locus notch homolog protein 1-like [Haliotis rubra]|uniref:neurogenic locus notch homolog protein 1-like n=1 Tax=Haliotis rubra TaxID=36100 RepID=UPI001EE60D71|nr:neurogenic locus notch homolog protein 1-like [Haliotis rubra]
MNACASNGPCQNGAMCLPVQGAPYQTCSCPEGFTGTNCETNLCMPNPCNTGSCGPASNANGYNCTCTGNYFGVNCESNLCLNNPCNTNDTDANCTYPDPANVQTRLCVCNASAGFHGELCELNVCQPDPCNGGSCSNIGNTDYMCTCPFNRTGQNCTEAVCPGTPTECSGRGICVPDGTTPKCNCSDGFFGNNCESQVPPCGIPLVPRIFGGAPDQATENPWNVKIVQTVTNDVFCSGTIIDLDWVVFDGYCAAFCGGACHVLLGDGAVVEQVRNMSNVQVHPDAKFNTSIQTLFAVGSADPENVLPYNVALARLSAPINPAVGVNRVCPPADVYSTFRAPRNCKVSGFGQQTQINETLFSNASTVVRQVLDAVILDDSVCSFIRNRSQPATTHCGFSTSGALVCNGDNGAAVVCQNVTSGEWTIEGTVSYLPDNTANTCARTFVYTDMNAFMRGNFRIIFASKMKVALTVAVCVLVVITQRGHSFVFRSPCEIQKHTCYDASQCPTGTQFLESLCFDNKICCIGVKACSPDSCINGTCIQNTCTCHAGFSGANCDVDACAGNGLCQNGGVCQRNNTEPKYSCVCAPGYHGLNCEVDACAGNGPCLNGGPCNRQVDAPYYTCACPLGFTGANCDIIDVVPPCGMPVTSRIVGASPTRHPRILGLSKSFMLLDSFSAAVSSSTGNGLPWTDSALHCSCDGMCNVVVGDYDGATVEAEEQVRSLTNYSIHPNANFNDLASFGIVTASDPDFGLAYNVAIARLSSPITFSNRINRVCPPSDLYNVFRAPRTCVIAGYGKQNTEVCNPSPCGNHGSCSYDSNAAGYTCSCRDFYSGPNCEST